AGARDAYVRVYGPDGGHLWTRQFGTTGSDEGLAVAFVAGGDVLVAGHTFGDLEGMNLGIADGFVRRYGPDGDHVWTRQFGTSSTDIVEAIAVGGQGDVYVAGHTLGSLEGANAGDLDVFVRKYDSDGNHEWTRQFGTPGPDVGRGVAVGADGHVLVVGHTSGDLEGASAGGYDVFLRRCDAEGDHVWTRQFGTANDDFARDVAAGAAGSALVAGTTAGAL